MATKKEPTKTTEVATTKVTNAQVALFDKASKAGVDYFPQLRFMTSQAKLCKSGKFPINHFAMVTGQSFQDLGDAIDVAILDFRAKALDTDEGRVSYDPDSSLYQEIVSLNDSSDGTIMHGPEFLVWMPKQEKFGVLYCCTKTARIAARDIYIIFAEGDGLVTLVPQEISTKKYDYWAFAGTACKVPFALPSPEALAEAHVKFEAETEEAVRATATDKEAASVARER